MKTGTARLAKVLELAGVAAAIALPLVVMIGVPDGVDRDPDAGLRRPAAHPCGGLAARLCGATANPVVAASELSR